MSFDVPSGQTAVIATPRAGDARLGRLSLNQKTTDAWPLPELVHACAEAGLRSIGLWREPVQELGIAKTGRLVRSAGLRVSSLCRGGFLTSVAVTERQAALDNNRRAIDESAELGAACLVMVVGGLPAGDRDLRGARQRMVDGLGALVPYARAAGVRLGLEPMHPIYAADRGVLSTLKQALDVAELFAEQDVGVVIDTFHVWWDPDLPAQIDRADARICGFQVGDWITPLPSDALLARGMMGDGHIDIPSIRRMVEATVYSGDIEVEIFSRAVWNAPPQTVLETVMRRYVTHVLDPSGQS